MKRAGQLRTWAAPSFSRLSLRSRAALVFILVVLAAIALGASQTQSNPLVNLALDVVLLGILVGAWVCVHSEVLRPADALAKIAVALTLGREETQPPPSEPTQASPSTISLWASVNTFAGVLQAQAHRTEAAIAVERVVLREVNHRIRNNLQMVASILAIQARADETGGAPRALGRVNLLSLAQDRIYASGDMDNVRLDDLAAEIGRNLQSARGTQAHTLRLDLVLTPAFAQSDAAVPMAFLMGESLSHALDLLGPISEAILIMTVCAEADGSVLFSLASPDMPEHRPLPANAARVMEAFAIQLGAEIVRSPIGPELVRIKLKPPRAAIAR